MGITVGVTSFIGRVQPPQPTRQFLPCSPELRQHGSMAVDLSFTYLVVLCCTLTLHCLSTITVSQGTTVMTDCANVKQHVRSIKQLSSRNWNTDIKTLVFLQNTVNCRLKSTNYQC